MTKHIGIAACSAEGAALYRTILSEAQAIMKHTSIPVAPSTRSLPADSRRQRRLVSVYN
jgi:hypothetical protein